MLRRDVKVDVCFRLRIAPGACAMRQEQADEILGLGPLFAQTEIGQTVGRLMQGVQHAAGGRQSAVVLPLVGRCLKSFVAIPYSS